METLRADLGAEDFVVGLAGAEEGERIEAADFVEAHDATEAGLGEESVGVGEGNIRGGEEDNAASGGGLDALDGNLRAIFVGRIGYDHRRREQLDRFERGDVDRQRLQTRFRERNRYQCRFADAPTL